MQSGHKVGGYLARILARAFLAVLSLCFVWIATYYHPDLAGETTALGYIYDPNAFTAACHPSLLNEWLLVTHIKSGRSVLVHCNDTGPFHWDNGCQDWDYIGEEFIDLSEAAFSQLAPLSKGVIEVDVMPTTIENWL